MRVNKIVNPIRGKSGFSWFFEQYVYDPRELARAVKAGNGSGNTPKVFYVYENKGAERDG